LVENSARIKFKDDEIAKLDGAHVGLGWCYERVDSKFHWLKKKTWTQCLFMHVNLTLTRTKLGFHKTSIRPKYTPSNHNETLQFLECECEEYWERASKGTKVDFGNSFLSYFIDLKESIQNACLW